ncbi:hypothetical protein VTO73DRAFT_13778 [Trametes versicolor]
MSATTGAAAGAAAYPPPLPPGLTYTAALAPSLNLVLIGTVWSAFLVPIAIALFFFSTAATRRQPVFIMNVLSISFGLVEGAINIYNQTRAILVKPVNPNVDTAFASMTILVPIFAELVLLFRVVAVYPPRILSWRNRILIYVPIVAFKVARIVNAAVFISRWVRLKKDTINPLLTGQEAWSLPNPKIEWFVQFFDTIYVSTLFLARLQQSAGNEGLVRVSIASRATRSATIPARLRTLFWIAVSNFVVPVLLNLVQLIYVFRDPDFLHGTYIFLVNNYVQIIGVLLATIWSSGTQWSQQTTRENAGAEIKFTSASRTGRSTEMSTTMGSGMGSEEQFQEKETV